MNVNVSIVFNAVIHVNDGADLESLLFNETEWMGEPKSPNGCVITLIPKKYEVDGKPVLPSTSPSPSASPEPSNSFPIVKAVKLNKDARVWIKKFKKIRQALISDLPEAIFMVQYPNGAMSFNTPHESVIRQDVCIIVENNQVEMVHARMD